MTLVEAMSDPLILGRGFDGPSWEPWKDVARVLGGGDAPRNEDLVRRCTGGRPLPTDPVREAFLICGRRAGKSYFTAALATHQACLERYVLKPGEMGTLMVLAADRKQARVLMRYIKANFQNSELLSHMIARDTQTEIELSNGITIEITTANYRTLRGYTVVGAICDELAFWRSEDSSNPDTEVLNALRPAMATVPNARLLCISSPYSRRGELWKAYQRDFGKDGDVLVWQAASTVMNPQLPQSIIDAAYQKDPVSAAAEYGAEFRGDLETFLIPEAVEACVTAGLRERPAAQGVAYHAFLDFAGGSGNDSATLAIAHAEGDTQVLDVVREIRPPFSPQLACEEFAATLHLYGVSAATSDKWGGQFPVEQMRKFGVRLEPSARPKSDLYLALLPLVNSGAVALLDHARLLAQLVGLERRTGRGRDHVDHAPGAHDDVANAVAGALATSPGPTIRVRSFLSADEANVLQRTQAAAIVARSDLLFR